MHIKYARPSADVFQMPVASLVDVLNNGEISKTWQEKRAAVGMFAGRDLRPAPGHALIHLIATGDGDYYGSNRNGDRYLSCGQRLKLASPDWDRVLLASPDKDGRPRYDVRSPSTFTDRVEYGNRDRVWTFEKFAKVFEEHRHHDYPHVDAEFKKLTGIEKMLPPDKVYGAVKAAGHNDRMKRAELMIQVPMNRDWNDDLEKIASGGDIGFSIGCRVPYDICDTCGHKAPTPDDYCPHVAGKLGQLDKVGRIISVANDAMTYFDISRVARPADRIAWSLYALVNGT